MVSEKHMHCDASHKLTHDTLYGTSLGVWTVRCEAAVAIFHDLPELFFHDLFIYVVSLSLS